VGEERGRGNKGEKEEAKGTKLITGDAIKIILTL
jgi:hypothetical protein